MATASAGTAGSLRTTDMRALLKATDEIDTLAVAIATAMHLKAVAGSNPLDQLWARKQLLESP